MAQITLNSTGVASSGSLVLQSNGTTAAVTVDTAQNVGIGTSSPATKLQVSNTAAYSTVTVTGNSANGGILSFVDSAGVTTQRIVGFGSTAGENTSLRFDTNGSERMRLDASGNVGLGVTPSSWTVFNPVLQIKTSSGAAALTGNANDNIRLFNNAYYDGAYKRIGAGYASYYEQDAGKHAWHYAGTSTAGSTISFTQAMTLDASGNLGVGVTSPNGKLSVAGNITLEPGGSGPVASSRPQLWRGADGFLGIQSGGDTGGVIAFHTSSSGTPSERARIDSSGNLLVGTTTTSGITSGSSDNAHAFISFEGNINAQRNNGGCLYLSKASGYTSSIMVSFGVTGTERGSITTSGTAVAYNTSSDYRLKENIAPMTGALAKVAALKPCTYKWKIDGSDGEGFIAHELQAVVPEAVHGEKDAVDEDGNPKYQGIDTSFLVATLTAAIQELKAIVDAQAAEIAALKG